MWTWEQVTEESYQTHVRNDKMPGNEYKTNKSGHFIKKWTNRPVFCKRSFGFRPKRSTHDALAYIKRWSQATVWFIDYDIRKTFDNVNG